MRKAQEIIVPLGQDGLSIEGAQDPTSLTLKALTNSPDGSLKTAVNVDFQGKENLHRRKGFEDFYYDPDDGTEIIHEAFDATGAVVADKSRIDLITYTNGVRGLARYTYLDNRAVKGSDVHTIQYDLSRYTIFATQDNDTDETPNFPETHTYHVRNRGTPYIRQLEIAPLDRLVFPNEFSDVNITGCERARFWNYLTVPRLGETETYLLGTYGGHFKRPLDPVQAPYAWECGAAGVPGFPPFWPLTGSFDSPYVHPQAHQRRVMFWWPEWYYWWADNRLYPTGGGIEAIGASYWHAPFIWYYENHSTEDAPDDFYAEPCGRFLERYTESLFMARIERTELRGNMEDESGYWVAGTPTWIYRPSEIMWSFWGMTTGMELGTPPVYPFEIAGEPAERVWGCAAYGYDLRRVAYFRRGNGESITGLKCWNNSLYVMKPSGFMQIYGTYSENFQFIDLQMSQGPCGAHAWDKADEGIYYVTKKGLYLFDGNPASQNQCLSDFRVKKIFEEDIDWGSALQMLSGEIVGVIVRWDKSNSQIIISYPRIGEQGAGTNLPAGTPTRQLVYDTKRGRFTEWVYRLPYTYEDDRDAVGIGMMLGGEDPTDDDWMLFTHPIGNNNLMSANGRILFRGNHGHMDAVAVDATGTPDPTTGDRIPYNIITKDSILGSIKQKQAITRQRSIIYANDGHIKRKVIYNYYDALDEEDLVYGAGSEDGYRQSVEMANASAMTGSATFFATVAFEFYHDGTDNTDSGNMNVGNVPMQFVAMSFDAIVAEAGDVD